MNRDRFYITTPIYYVNDKPHIGHSYTTILADVLARYQRLLDVPTFFLTGTDEHGQKVQQAAEKAGITPQEQADQTVVNFQQLWEKLDITNDDFIRTTEPRHAQVVQEILQALYDRGEIYKAEYDGWYDVTNEVFVTEKDLPEGVSPEDLPNVTRITESNYFFKMSNYRDWLIEYIEQHPEFIQPDFRRNETLGFLRKELTDLCISRPKSRLSWGIELPFDSDFVCYVWFDALVNYISAVGYLRDDECFEKWWPVDYHLIGKDILTTHTVYWPTMLKAMGLPMPRTIFAHGWWLSGQAKMSKSLGNVVNPMEMIERYGVDAFRYFLMAEMVLGQDASFTEEGFIKRYNADLANDLGNLLSRLLKMVNSYCGGNVPSPGEGALQSEGAVALWEEVTKAVHELEQSINEMRLDKGLHTILAGVRAVNRYLEQQKPWSAFKEGGEEAVAATLYLALDALRVFAGLLYPVMPEKMASMLQQLGLDGGDPNIADLARPGMLPAGQRIGEAATLFPRIQKAAPEKAPPENRREKEGKTMEEGLITFDEFLKTQLRTAEILEAEKVEGADKLLKLQVRVGDEKRQIVAGIAQHYDPAELPGRHVVIVANLKPANIRGVESQGMLLAASAGDALRIVTVDGDLPSGATVK